MKVSNRSKYNTAILGEIMCIVGYIFGEKVYENGLATVKIPKSIRQGSDLLLMSIPNCGKSYFLLMQLDVDFKPLFTMLESHQDSTGYHQISRFRKIDVGRIQIVEEEVNFSLLYNEGSLSSASPANRSPIQNSRSYPKSSRTGQPETMLKSLASGLRVISPVCQTSDCGASHGNMSIEMPKYRMSNRKRCLSDLVHSIPSLQQIAAHGERQKKRKTVCESGNPQPISDELNTQGSLGKFVGRSYGDIFMEANHGKAPSRIYTSVLLQVVRRCFLFIKHDCLTSQMAALGIPCIEDTNFRKPSSDFWFQLPLCRENAWENMGLLLVNPGSTYWDVKVNDDHFRDLWELHKGKTGTPWGSGVRIANTSDVDSHIQYGPEGVILSYRTLEENSIQKLVADLQRLSNARSFAMGMRRFLGVKPDEKIDTGKENCNTKTQNPMKIGAVEGRDRMWRLIGKGFRIEAVGLMSIWFSYFESMPGSIARFVVEWETGKEGCTMHVFPNQLWPHTKFLEDFIDRGEVERLLDCIRLTAGPLHALSDAIWSARMVGAASTGIALVASGFPTAAKTNELMLSQGGPGIVPSSLLPTDVSVVLLSPCLIRIFYRKKFAVDMRCSVGDQVWLQPAIPPKGGPDVGGSMPCPQFQKVILKYVAFGLNTLETSLNPYLGDQGTSDNSNINIGYGGGWVPLASLKNVLRGILNYLGVLWLFFELVDILHSILKEDGESFDFLDFERPALGFRVRGYVFALKLPSVQRQRQRQPQLHLQVVTVEQFNLQKQGQRQQQQPRNQTNSPDQLNSHEIGEIRDFFSRRVASEPYDASRVASFITLLLLPISVLREFLKLIAWKKGITQGQGADTGPSQRPRVELCLESHIGSNSDKAANAVAKSNIHYDRPHNAVDFGLIIVPNPACMPRVNASSSAGWLPHCVSVRLKYSFGENPHVSLLSMEGSHRGCAGEDWERCKQEVAKAVEIAGRGSGVCGSSVNVSQGRLRVVAETLQHSLQSSLFQL